MTQERRKILKRAKAAHKRAIKNSFVYNRKRDELVRQMFGKKIPNWGAVNVIVLKW